MKHNIIFFNFFLTLVINVLFYSYSLAQDSVSIIMYHRFGEPNYPSTNIQMDRFESHIIELKNPKYNIMKLSKIIEDEGKFFILKLCDRKFDEKQQLTKKDIEKHHLK